jgi:hypothetical protein
MVNAMYAKTLQQLTPKNKVTLYKRAVLVEKACCYPCVQLSSQNMPEIAYTRNLQPSSLKKHSTTLPVVTH